MINHIYQLITPHFFSVVYDDIDLDGQVIVRPRYMSICHADQRYYLGMRDAKILKKKLPMALIHECCGEVVYDKSGNFKIGQKVVLIPNVPGKSQSDIYENYSENAKFLSSSVDGFMREFVAMPADRLVPFDNIKYSTAAITEFVSVTFHACNRLEKAMHSKRDVVGIWGDGSLSYVLSCVLKERLPKSKIIVFGKDLRKLSYFTMVDETYMIDNIPQSMHVDHAFECAGGEGSALAINDIIKYIKPQGTAILLGVSENKVPINTRDILEKGFTFIGCSRSGREDFVGAVELMEKENFQIRLDAIITLEDDVCSIPDIYRVFKKDTYNLFKTVFRWNI
ncbi:MAG: alcohol dehydrogenase catalytic domain-containing protein [Clostridia bacterium]|nr:alcohol dehydrogenase catalytic domain-containing protein [Clostridia bacterium]